MCCGVGTRNVEFAIIVVLVTQSSVVMPSRNPVDSDPSRQLLELYQGNDDNEKQSHCHSNMNMMNILDEAHVRVVMTLFFIVDPRCLYWGLILLVV